jgi:hypothetical protein
MTSGPRTAYSMVLTHGFIFSRVRHLLSAHPPWVEAILTPTEAATGLVSRIRPRSPRHIAKDEEEEEATPPRRRAAARSSILAPRRRRRIILRERRLDPRGKKDPNGPRIWARRERPPGRVQQLARSLANIATARAHHLAAEIGNHCAAHDDWPAQGPAFWGGFGESSGARCAQNRQRL